MYISKTKLSFQCFICYHLYQTSGLTLVASNNINTRPCSSSRHHPYAIFAFAGANNRRTVRPFPTAATTVATTSTTRGNLSTKTSSFFSKCCFRIYPALESGAFVSPWQIIISSIILQPNEKLFFIRINLTCVIIIWHCRHVLCIMCESLVLAKKYLSCPKYV